MIKSQKISLLKHFIKNFSTNNTNIDILKNHSISVGRFNFRKYADLHDAYFTTKHQSFHGLLYTLFYKKIKIDNIDFESYYRDLDFLNQKLICFFRFYPIESVISPFSLEIENVESPFLPCFMFFGILETEIDEFKIRNFDVSKFIILNNKEISKVHFFDCVLESTELPYNKTMDLNSINQAKELVLTKKMNQSIVLHLKFHFDALKEEGKPIVSSVDQFNYLFFDSFFTGKMDADFAHALLLLSYNYLKNHLEKEVFMNLKTPTHFKTSEPRVNVPYGVLSCFSFYSNYFIIYE